MKDVVSEVRRIVSRVTRTPEDQLTLDVDLIDTGMVDSMRALQIVNDLERAFDVLIPDDEVGSFTTIRTIAEGIVRLKGK